MKITKIKFNTGFPELDAIFSFKDPTSNNPYNVKYITGLDAENIISKTYNSKDTFGFRNLSLPSRELVIRVGLNPAYASNQSYSDLRDKLYKIISSNRYGIIPLEFYNTGEEPFAEIIGTVTKFESNLFEKNQEVQLTISCYDPMFRSYHNILHNPYDTDSPIGQPLADIIDSNSTAPHGLLLISKVHSNQDILELSDPNDISWSFKIGGAHSGSGVYRFINGDLIEISTENNSKYINLVRVNSVGYSVKYPIADLVYPDSVWPIMFPGHNTLQWSTPSDMTWDYVSYFEAYWGI